MALTLNDEIAHMVERHREMEAVYVCVGCGKRYIRKHAALCHVPKCTGRAPPPANGEVCKVCGKTYKTKSGLSQHERHEHPDVRNEARAGESAEKAHTSRKGIVFTEEEENLMLDMEIRFRGERNMARRMVDFLPGKTLKQIRDKRAILSYKKRRDAVLAPLEKQGEEDEEGEEAEQEVIDVPEEDDELPIPPGDPPHQNADEQSVVGTDTAAPNIDEASDSHPEAAWREGIAREVLAIESPDAIPPEAAACVQLLRRVLAEVVDGSGELPSAEELELTDQQVSNYMDTKGDTAPKPK